MRLNQELLEAISEETTCMNEDDRFKVRFTKLIENYMDGMGSEAEIADVINLVTLTGDEDED